MNSINTLYTLLPFLILLFSNQILVSSQTTLKDPILVIEVIRHGIRAPTTSAYDPFWKNLTGELLPQGMRQTYVLGKAIALEYPHLLSKYKPDEVYVRAINLNRTIMSAVSHLSGTFGPHYGHLLSKGQLKHIDVPYNYSSSISERLKKVALPHNFRIPAVHTAEFEHDYLLYASNSKVCPISKELKEEQESSQYYLNYKEKMSSTITNLNELTGEEFGFHDISNFYSTLNIDHILNRTFPAPYDRVEFGSELWRNLTFIHDFNEFYGSYGSQLQVELYSSLLLTEILELFQRSVNGTDTKFKYALYSGSDTLLMPLLHALGIASHECFADQFFNGTKHDLCMYPTFASNILFELHKGDEGDYYVKVKYNSKEANLCSTKDKKCKFNDFEDVIVTAVNGMTLEKYKQICGIPSHSKHHHHHHHSKQKDSMVWYLPIAFSMVIFIIVISKIIHSKLKQMTKKNGISETLIKEYMIESLQA